MTNIKLLVPEIYYNFIFLERCSTAQGLKVVPCLHFFSVSAIYQYTSSFERCKVQHCTIHTRNGKIQTYHVDQIQYHKLLKKLQI